MAHEHVKRGGKVWFLVHRQELRDQALKIVGDDPNIYVGMVLSKKPFTPTLIIFDEAHHSTARTWLNIIHDNPNAYIIGLTATPCRLDGSSLGSIYEKLIVGVEADDLIKYHYLAPYEYYAPANLVSDFKSDSENQDFYFDKKIYGDVLKYIDPARKTIIYCPNIKFSRALAEYIPNSVHFDGDTPDNERKLIIDNFRVGNIRVLLNVDLIGEGFDVPDCDCCILLRPTMSTALYIQQAMRCMRYVENKTAIIYDLVGNVFRHGMPTEHREWSLNKPVKVRNKSAIPDLITRQCKKCYRVYAGVNPICPYCNTNNGKTRKQIEIEKRIELERITEINRKNKRMEVGRARTLDDLIKLGISRGYSNPRYWALKVLQGRRDRC